MLLAEGEGFKTANQKTVERTTKSASIPLGEVQRVWRKIHSPHPLEANVANSPGFSGAQNSAKAAEF
jgi:hypothetical protein